MKRTGLIRIAIGSTHLIALPEGPMQCTARDYRNHEAAKAVYFCQHRACEGKTWPTHEAMRAAHPDSEQMAKANETHTYGMWSSDMLDAKAAATAKAALDLATKYEAELAKTQTKGFNEREHHKLAVKELEAAQAEATIAAGCIGLIAPPESRFDEA